MTTVTYHRVKQSPLTTVITYYTGKQLSMTTVVTYYTVKTVTYDYSYYQLHS
jgi:hypothetical protein